MNENQVIKDRATEISQAHESNVIKTQVFQVDNCEAIMKIRQRRVNLFVFHVTRTANVKSHKTYQNRQ